MGYTTPLISAILARRPDAVRVLIELGANVNFKGQRYFGAFVSSCESGNFEIIKLLIDSGIEIPRDGLHIFARSGYDNPETFKLLLDCGYDIYCDKFSEISVLSEICKSGFVECLDWLLTNYPDTDLKDSYGNHVMYQAAFYGRYEVVDLMVNKYKVDVNQKLSNRYSFLSIMCIWPIDSVRGEKEDLRQVVKILLDAGMDLKETYDGMSLIEFASKEGRYEMVEILENL